MKKLILILLCLANMLAITYFSSQGVKESATLSKNVTEEIIIPIMETVGMPVEQSAKEFDKYTRGAAHVALFLTLGILLCCTLKTFDVKYAFLIAFAICFLYAIFDESLQKLLGLGRAFEFVDLIKDWSGSLIGALAVNILYPKKEETK